ncbi:hypothetical protein C0Z18_17530 [Trinickia dabaoshanensis]|uniref:Carrier domain-containing protein n=1 Tax=Trinickia dabaoshanensis TaxID=564714 RepID=A0A2N7VMJ2_9BURK|nr:hypothetical protein C0Z18_17530 [Trinickia dabaoshanensis]
MLDLSASQLEMWFSQKLDPNNPFYDSGGYMAIHGPIDPAVFEKSLRQFVAEAEILHFRFVEGESAPAQWRGLPPELPFEHIDVSGAADPFAAALSAMQALAAQVFDLIAGPLMVYRLFKLGEGHYVWYQRYHHIVMDGMSVTLAARRVEAIYGALIEARPIPLCDFAPAETLLHSDDRYRASPRYASDHAYWREYAATLPEPATLNGGPPDSTGAFLRSSIRMPDTLAEQLLRAEERIGKWPQVVTAIIAAYLFRYTDGRATVFDFPVAARSKETRDTPGSFANVLPLHIPMRAGDTLVDLSERVAGEIFKHLKHQQYRIKDIRQMTGAPRAPIFGPRINLIAFDNSFRFGTAGGTMHSLSNGMVNDFAVTVTGQPGTASFELHVDGNARLHDAPALSAHARRMVAFMEEALADPCRPIGRVRLLDAAERARLLDEVNATEADYPSHLCVHEQVERQAERTPDAVALECGDRRVTYAELNVRADRLAHDLIALGVRPDTRVAVCAPRSIDLIIGLLAVLKAGGAYVPIDPGYPATRIAHILRDAAPLAVLVDSAQRQRVVELLETNTPLIELDAAEAPWREGSSADPLPKALGLRSDHLAYVIYTSGSTGTPKGVTVEHRQLGNLIAWHVRRFELRPRSRTTSTAGIAFDAAAWEIWPALCCGATLLLPPADIAGGTATMLEWWRSQRIDCAFLVTPLALLAIQAGLPAGLRRLLIGGDRFTAVPAPLPASVQLINNYGPTEATVVATCGPIVPEETVHTIGRPIENARIYLLDAHGEPVPTGAIGEIYIGGAGVARGYLNRPEDDAQRFLPDPFARAAGKPHARMYRTGDLGRYLPDGRIVFLGRNDQQLKIRGFRIEPGEIETQLLSHPNVREAAVAAVPDAHGQTRLVAYVVAQPNGAHASELARVLRAHLQTRLPEYMLPAAFVPLKALPLTPNGKLDRNALPAPSEDAFVHHGDEMPETDIERLIAAIWSDLLHIDRIGRHDNFFALGGHSLLAIQAIERLRRHGWPIAGRALFQHPTPAELAAALQDERAHEPRIVVPPNRLAAGPQAITPDALPLADLSQAEIDHIVEHVPGGIDNVQDIYALAPLQDGILFHHLMSEAADPYLLSTQMHFADRATLDRYLAAMQRVVDRHDVLRTAFAWDGLSEAVQIVYRKARLPVETLSFDPNEGPVSEQLRQRFNADRYRMDLTCAPLLRFVLAPDCATDGGWDALVLLHHMVGDHSTLELMHAEVQAALSGREAQLLEPVPYRDLVAQARLGIPPHAHEAFFREMLADIDAPTLAYGLASVRYDGTQAIEAARTLPAALCERLRAQARRLGVGVAALCHLGWAAVLAAVSGERKVVFGTVLFGRMAAGSNVDRAMGLYINTLPLRIDIGADSVEHAARAAQQRLTRLLAHEHASLALAQRCSAAGATTPLFNAILNYRHNSSMPHRAADSIAGVQWFGGHERTNYPLAMSVDDDGHGLTLSAQAVDPASPTQLCAYLEHALERIGAALEAASGDPFDRLLTLPASERYRLVENWNATDRPFASALCMHHLFERQADETPHATAVAFDGRRLTYAQLNARANRLAHRLIEYGVRPDSLAAVCAERGIAMVVALLAILKAGGAYVPLDPSHPSERLAYILGDADPMLLLVDRTSRAATNALPKPLPVIDLGEYETGENDDAPARNPHAESLGLTSRHLAYVIYTSGSTGMPKGVQNEHRALVNRLVWMQRAYRLQADDIVLQKTPFSFDVSVWEFFWTLANGATLCIAPPGVHRDAHRLAALIAEQRVTTAHFVPSMLASFLEATGAAQCTSLRRIVCSGEALPAATVRRCRNLLPATGLHNLYGPTEAAIDVTAWSCPATFDADIVPIGKPIDNTRIYLLDERGEPVPPGAVGELYIGGVGVARGYLNRPELTAERFIEDPFASAAGKPYARMYRTGDLARYLPDGNIVFLGRNDHQVKIRGLRIELGEIEAQLAAHASVREAVVLARNDDSGEPRLVAYVTTNEAQQSTAATNLTSELRAYLLSRLPDYMVPVGFVRLASLPVTANGKLDRRALPAPAGEAFARRHYEAPQGEAEQTLAALWAELLHVDRIGRHDDFFELGGHSIVAMRMVARLHATTGKRVALRTVFEAPTIARLAAAVAAIDATDALGRIVRIDRRGELPLSFAEARALAIEASASRRGMLNSSNLLLLSGIADHEWIDRALRTVVDRHEILRTHYEADAETGTVRPVIGAPGAFTLDIRRTADLDGDGLRAAQLAAAETPDCFTGPIFRATLFADGSAQAILLIAVHHIAVDAASWTLIWRDFASAYEALAEGRAPDLAPPELQYRDYAAWQRHSLDAPRVADLERRWQEMLAGAPVRVDLPADRPRPPVMSSKAGRVALKFPAEVADAIRRASAAHHVTPFVVLETTLALLCARLAHSREITIGTVAEGREAAGTESMVGLFVNTIALRHRVRPNAALAEHWEAAADTLLSALDIAALPFADIVAAVHPPRSSSYDPIFQVFCQLQHGIADADDSFAGLTGEPIAREEVARGADLAVIFETHGDALTGSVIYSADLFDESSVEAIAALYMQWLSHGSKHPESSIDSIWEASLSAARLGPHGGAVARLVDRRASASGAWYPLSASQQSLWLREQAAPEGTAFSSVAVMRCPATVDRERLARAALALVTQNQSFRLEWTALGLQRETFAPATLHERIEMTRPIADDDAWQVVQDWHHRLCGTIPDTTCAVATFEAADGILVALRTHHVQNDGWSAIRLFERIAKNYAALADDPSQRFETDRFFLDTIASEHRYLASPAYATDAEYWRDRCAAIESPPLVTQLADRPFNTNVPALVASVRRSVSKALRDKLADAAKILSLSPAECLTAMTTLYLARISRQHDVTVGISFLNRSREALDIPGQFAQVLPLHADFAEIEAQRTAAAALACVCEAFKGALRHGAYPYGELVRVCRLDPRQTDVSVNTLFLRHGVEIDAAAAPIRWLSGPESGLSFLFTQFGRSASIDLELRFNRALFDTQTVTRHADRLLGFIDQVCGDVSMPLDEIALIDEKERRLTLVRWNDTDAAFPAHLCMHQLFEQQVERTPHATAVVFGHEHSTYAELNARANRLAHQLIALGVRPDSLVAVCAERSVAMVVALLGVLKAGGAYVPLDPSYPADRLARILGDARPAALLVDQAGGRTLHACLDSQSSVVRIDTPFAPPQGDTDSNPDAEALGLRSDHLAYVIYTSGSTGMPKGVKNEHRALVNRLVWMQRAYRLQADDIVLQKTPFSFDVSVWEFFWTLANGATLCIAPPGVHRDAHRLATLIAERRVTTAHFVPSMLAGFLEAKGAAQCTSLRRIVCSGEALPAATVRRCRNLLPATGLHNLYGPTEAAIDVTAWSCPATFDADIVPIGKPIDNTRIYLLDERGEPVPTGAVGELYIGGVGVARGYLNRPELTAERFIEDPFASAAGKPYARMYRTGDLARYLPDGNIVFLGRNDHQVKIRGLRIELGEIEAQLAAHASVREAVVLAREDDSGEPRLVAYVTVREGHATAAQPQLSHSLRVHLLAKLPEFMVPSAFVELAALPVTANGKLDRKALPAPSDEAFARQDYDAPRDDVEQALAALWAELLHVDRIGRHDNFFALGGHSLLAVRLLSRLPALFGIELPLSTLFSHPTLCAFAEAAAAAATRTGMPMLPPITRAEREQTFALSFAQQRLWFLTALEGDSNSTTYHVPVVLRLRGTLDVDHWHRALDSVWRRHEALRTVFPVSQGGPTARLLPPEQGMPWRIDDLSASADALTALRRLCEAEARAPFDLLAGPLIRARLVRLAEGEYVFMLVQHHIVSDGWSIRVIVGEILAHYQALQDGEIDPLPELEVQYPDYVAWQRRWLNAERLAGETDYWRRTLGGAPALLTLPTDRPRPPRQRFEAAHVAVALDTDLTQALRRVCRQQGVTLFMLVAAAWSVVLSRLSGQSEVVIGTPTANRPRAELEPLIGLFVNSLALRIDLAGEPGIAELLARVRDTVLGAQEHQNLPFEQVVEIVQPWRRLDHTPIFQVMIAWQEIDIGPLQSPSLRIEPVPGSLDQAKFDLELDLADDGGAVSGALRYAVALFDERTITRHVGYLTTILRVIADGSRLSLERVPLVDGEEYEQLSAAWNATGRDYPARVCVHELVERQAARTPEAIAVEMGEQRITYAQLNARANRLARFLRARGVRPDSRVAVCVSRSVELAVALVAVLKAGGAYVPIDPAHAGLRVTYVLADSEPIALLVDRATREVMGASLPDSVPVFDLDGPHLEWDDASAENLRPDAIGLDAHHLAYVIYTSGSTGTPKGVMVEHRQLGNLIAWHTDRFELASGSRTTCMAGLAFDATAWEIWPALACGATLLLPPAQLAGDTAAMLRWWRSQQIDTAFLVTPLALLALDSGLPASLRHLLIGGDRFSALRVPLPESVQLVDNYGPTETTVVATSGLIDPSQSVHTIGRPIANTRIYLLDAHGQPVPTGAVGEIYIGGAGVARGYLNRPDLDAERFLPDPFAIAAGTADARMYRTGDLARYLSDGRLVFLGRDDQQVKIRGFRIELGEIEAQLRTHPGLRDVAVVATQDARGETRLIAYVVTCEEAADPHAIARSLRAHLQARLPDYMMPAAFTALPALPLTSNGKLDRRALPEASDAGLDQPSYEAPHGKTESALAEIWAQLIGLDRVGRHDNFFMLGGHSLLAARMIGEVRAALGRELSIRTLFESPTIAQLAARIERGADSDALAVMLALRKDGSGAPMFCIHPAGGFSWPYAGLLRYLPERPIYALQARGLRGNGPPATTIEAIASDYLAQIRAVQPEGPYHLLGWSLGCHIAHAIATQLQDIGERVEQLVMLDGYPLARDEEVDEPDDQDLMRLLVRALSDATPQSADQPLTLQTVKQQLVDASAGALSALGDGVIDAVFHELKAAPALASRFTPRKYRGDVLFFRARQAGSGEPGTRTPSAWQPYVDGHIETHDIQCAHEAMMRPHALAQIGPALAAALERVAAAP